MKTSKLIGLSGFAGSGKDEVAKILVEACGYKKKAFADKLRNIATYLDVYMPEIGMTYNQWLEKCGSYEEAKRRHPCIRKHLVDLGHGARTILWESIWIDNVLPERKVYESILDSETIRKFALHINAHYPQTSQSYSEICESEEPVLSDWCQDYLNKIEKAITSLTSLKLKKGDGRKIVVSDVRYKNESRRIRKEYGGVVWMVVRPGVGPANETEKKSIPEVKYDLIIYNDGSLEDLRRKVMLLLN